MNGARRGQWKLIIIIKKRKKKDEEEARLSENIISIAKEEKDLRFRGGNTGQLITRGKFR